ncbi:MAG: hypothetical protein ACE5H0_13655 [Bacteroidota bacterium]
MSNPITKTEILDDRPDSRLLEYLAKRRKIARKILERYEDVETALLQQIIGKVKCPKCGRTGKLKEWFPSAICPQHGLIHSKGRKGPVFCDLCGKRLKMSRHRVLIHDRIIEVRYLFRCNCGHIFKHREGWVKQFGIVNEKALEKLAKLRREYGY